MRLPQASDPLKSRACARDAIVAGERERDQCCIIRGLVLKIRHLAAAYSSERGVAVQVIFRDVEENGGGWPEGLDGLSWLLISLWTSVRRPLDHVLYEGFPMFPPTNTSRNAPLNTPEQGGGCGLSRLCR
jgi:hypothetical protein